jgi:hypothetical protein
MKNTSILITAALCLLVLPLAACSGFHFVAGTGAVVTKDYDFKDFKNIDISSALNYQINQAENFSLSISAHENILQYLDVYQTDVTLVVRLKSGSFTNTAAKATITLPELDRLSISGASKGSAKGLKSAASFEAVVSGASQLDLDAQAGTSNITVSGASRVTGHLVAQDTKFNVSGASRCELDGNTATTYVNVSGASGFTCTNLILSNANVNISGASHASVNSSGTLNVEVTGASTLDYYGNPSLNQVTVNGASQLNKK